MNERQKPRGDFVCTSRRGLQLESWAARSGWKRRPTSFEQFLEGRGRRRRRPSAPGERVEVREVEEQLLPARAKVGGHSRGLGFRNRRLRRQRRPPLTTDGTSEHIDTSRRGWGRGPRTHWPNACSRSHSPVNVASRCTHGGSGGERTHTPVNVKPRVCAGEGHLVRSLLAWTAGAASPQPSARGGWDCLPPCTIGAATTAASRRRPLPAGETSRSARNGKGMREPKKRGGRRRKSEPLDTQTAQFRRRQ
eukprot:GHVT01061101.1.p1 GENE.GHVT01061101.1~~GHVT01061101.1.p1  ORF type:complete len:250 (-),score=37.08 GHVT01061101.1:410-1159(-)